MKQFFTLALLALLASAYSQQPAARQAYLGEDGQVLTREVDISHIDESLFTKDDPVYDQMDGWPKKIVNHPNFKNFRGVTLADLDNDGADEILVASFNRIHVFKGNGDLLWSQPLIGTATYPPSVADVTGNGQLEVVQLTGGIPNNGRAYIFDKDGNVLTGWPVSIGNQWLLSAPTLADLDGSGQMEIIFGVRTVNEIHVLKADGTSFNENWPVTLSSIPAFTPSVGDINNDGEMNIIAGASNGTLYAFDLDANALPGFPVAATSTSFSYQSPLLADLDGDSLLSIIGATHGEAPQYYVRNSDGTYRTGWPKAVPGGGWTYHPPTLADITGDGVYELFFAKPVGESPAPMLFGYNTSGEMLPNFPISKAGGLESFISVADIDADGQHELIFGSNMMVDGQGFIHAWKTDGSGQLPGFPIRPAGFTFMNGANLGDVTGDGMLNLVALSYEQTFSATDSAVINVYNLGVTVEAANVLFGTYKGDNTRAGLMVIPGEDPDPDPVYATFRFSNAFQNSMDENVKLWYNDSLLVDNAFFGYASDLLQIQVNEPFDLSISFGENDDLVVVHTETLEMEENDLWLVFFAGDDQSGPAKLGDFPVGFYVYEDFKLHGDNSGTSEILIFDAFADDEHAAMYKLYLSNNDAIELENFRGEFRGYYPWPFDFVSAEIHSLQGWFIWFNGFSEFPGYEAGDVVVFLIAALYDDSEWYHDVPYPSLFLMPKTAGSWIYPGYAINNVEETDLSISELRIFPNPASDHFNVSFQAEKPGNLYFELYDALGRRVSLKQYEVLQGGYNQLQINKPDGLSGGIYFVKLRLGDQVLTGRVMLR